jgi:hypothetical protein
MQELSNSLKRQNLSIMSIEEGGEVQAKGIHNIFNKIITKNFPNLEKGLSFRYRKPPEPQKDLTKIDTPHGILSLKQQAQTTEKEY